MAKLKITHTNNGVTTDKYVSPAIVDGSHIGGTGGLTSQAGNQIQPVVYITGGSQLNGSILAQKGSHKFQVTDGTLTGDCKLVNSSSLSAGQMNLQITLSTITSATIATYSAGTPGYTYVTYTPSNVTGPVATPRVGDTLVGFTGYGASVLVTAVIAAGNVQVSVSGNVTTQTGTITDTTYASRITNKFVYDFGTDGILAANTAGGYNPNKFRYRLATPDSTFVQVKSA
jgi:hypothetical protein